MGKIIFEFDTNDPDDLVDIERHKQITGLANSLYELSNIIRAKLKYETLTKEEDIVWSNVKDQFYEILNNNNVDLDKIC